MATIELYRAVSEEEFADIQAHRAMRNTAGSLEGKWLAESVSDALRWGELLYGLSPFRVIAVEVDQDLANHFFRLKKLDNIGSARFAEIESLASAIVREVVDE